MAFSPFSCCVKFPDLFYNDVHELLRHADDLYDGLSRGQFLCPRQLHDDPLHRFPVKIGGDLHAVAHFPVDLENNFDLILYQRSFVILRPRLRVNVPYKEPRPKFRRNMRRKGCEHTHKCRGRFPCQSRMQRTVLEGIKCIDQLHNGGDRRVEHESVAYILRDLLHGTVEYTAQLRLLGTKGVGIIGIGCRSDRLLKLPQDTPYAAEEAERPLDALIATVEVTLDGRGEEDEEPRRIRAIAVNDLLG